MLTGYAESDFRSDATQGESVGVYQQKPRWWPSALLGTEAQCRAFVAAFKDAHKLHTGGLVHDCWLVQRWNAPGSVWPDPGPDFAASPSTINYARRVDDVDRIIDTGRLP